MRIISGKKKGLNLFSPYDYKVRPTTDKVKESIFNSLNEINENSVVLDLFSGSGAMGIEFLSRGAKLVYFCDFSKKSLEITLKNLKKSSFLDNSVILNMDYLDALKYFFEKKIKFDYVFLDPPYDGEFSFRSLDFIFSNDILNFNGIIILETDKDIDVKNFNVIKEKKYGRTKVLFLERNF